MLRGAVLEPTVYGMHCACQDSGANAGLNKMGFACLLRHSMLILHTRARKEIAAAIE